MRHQARSSDTLSDALRLPLRASLTRNRGTTQIIESGRSNRRQNKIAMPMRQTMTDKVIQRDQHVVRRFEVSRPTIHQPDQLIHAGLRRMEVEEDAE